MAATRTMSQTLTDAYEDIRSEAEGTARRATREAGETLRELPFAALGSVQHGLQRGRRTAERLAALPGRAVDTMRELPERWREAFEARVETGHDVVDRIRGSKSVRNARANARSARAAARSTATTARKAARSAARAAGDAVSSLDPADTRPYEERTVEELYELASERSIDGRSQMNKAQLIKALRSER